MGDRTPTAGTSRDAKAWQRRLAPTDAAASFANGRLPTVLMPVRWLVRGGVSLFMNSYVRVHASGRENIPTEGAFLLAPNHSSHLDSPSTISAIGGKRRVWVAGAQDYFFNTAMKRFLFGKILDTISFDRKADGIRGLRRCGDALSRGDGLLIFPEGTRSITGEIQPFKIGVAVLAIERSVPIVPVHIYRTFDLLRKGQRIVRPGVAHVRFGVPIVPPNPNEIDDHYTAFRELAAEVEQAVRGMRSEADAR
ncbi:MAG: 1-acyl-sn-glycerol-3-phosphate acyltransferase [Planctomycetes bacterium]|nr:1-acyl-sn-glycerol-3-phosphate acyltransferase [Planctomycetota bacterium]